MSAIYKRDESKIFSRINVLRENMLDAVPSLSSERAVLATEFYKNNEGNVQKFTLWIPMEITYYWGTLKAVAKCDVESTKANQ